MTIEVFAPAKINLTLHITGQRPDGFHLLDSLVMFAVTRDVIRVEHAQDLTLELNGPEAMNLPAGGGNLVMRAAKMMAAGRGAHITLTKNLPVASGIGGGSADAAATLHALSRLWDVPVPDRGQTLKLGADVPVCVYGKTARMTGVGEAIFPGPRLPKYAGMLLVNPRVGLGTPDVFARLSSHSNPRMPDNIPDFHRVVDLADWLGQQRNDLESPAIALQPVIASVLAAIGETDCLIARMSGSGASCFGLYETKQGAKAARAAIQARHPDWWSSWFDMMVP